MATQAQVFSNRQNSLLSTGPITADGRRIASQNSRKHGLTSKQIVLPGEDPAEYDALRESLIRDYAPANETERTLVEEVAAGSWRLARARRHETAILTKLIGDAEDPEAAFAELFVEKPKELERLLRYVTTIERAYYRALSKLEKLQKERTQDTGLQPFDAPIGFVSQNTYTSMQSLETSSVAPTAPTHISASSSTRVPTNIGYDMSISAPVR